jgi:hypothetical protein
MKRLKEEKVKKMRAATLSVLIGCGVLALGLTGCTTTVNGGDGPDVEEGQPTTLSISIPITETYADDNATANELAVKTAHIFIVNGASFEKDTTITVTAGNFTNTPGGAGVPARWKLTTPIKVNSGLRKIYVGLNLTAIQHAAVKTGVQAGYTNTTLRDQFISTGDGFVMFNDRDSVYNILPAITTPTTADNEFVVYVSRLVAKIAVTKKPELLSNPDNYNASGAFFDVASTDPTNGLAFSAGNVNTKTYFLQKKVAGIIEDPNFLYTPPPSSALLAEFTNDWGTFSTAASYTATALAVNAPGTSMSYKNVKYVTENTSDNPLLQGLLTYVSVKARFRPNNIVTAVDANGLATTATNTNYLNDLYVYTTAGGEFLYFTNASLGITWASHTANAGHSAVTNYKDAYCYYLIYLTPQSAYAGSTYASIRNLYYDVNISKFNALGYANPEEPDPENPLATPTNITVDVVIQNWTVVTSDTELGPI